MKKPITKKRISQTLLDSVTTALQQMSWTAPKTLYEDLAATMHPGTLVTHLRANLEDLKTEAMFQRKIWLKSTGVLVRPRNYRLPILPKGYESLVPTEGAELDNVEQTEENYGATLYALQVACRLYLALAQPPRNGEGVTIRDALEDYYHVHLATGSTLSELKQDYKRAVAVAARLDPDNILMELIFAELVMKGHACQGPLDVLDWSNIS